MESGRGRRRSAAVKSGCGLPPQTASRKDGRTDGSREEGRADGSREEGRTSSSREEGRTSSSREEGRASSSREEGREQQLQSRRAERLQRAAANGTRESKLQSAAIKRQ